MLKIWSSKQFSGAYADIANEEPMSRAPALVPSTLEWNSQELAIAKADWARLKPSLNFSDWLGALIASSGARKESYYQASLALQLNGRREISVPPFGRIDVVTASHCIEVKHAASAKHSIGQALVYAYATKLKPGIALFGDHAINKHIASICWQHEIALWLFKNEQWQT